MNVNIQIPDDIESALRRRAAAAGQDVATYVKEAVVERLEVEDEPTPPRRARREHFKEWLDRWTKLFPVLDHPIDDSRESFYEGRGE